MLAGLVLVAVPAALVFLEPDLGTAIAFVWVTFVLFLVGGVKARYLLGPGRDRRGRGGRRASAWTSSRPTSSSGSRRSSTRATPTLAQGPAFHTRQSLIAIGSGQFAGKGYLAGTQNNLAYVPENHTDFIFTIVGEEFGFFGAVIVLGLFAILLWRGLRIAMMAKDLFGTLVAASIVALLLLQVFVNVGMTVGIMPVTGIPLPFMSYGGTSLIVWFGLIGLLLNIHMRRFG